MGFKNKEDEKRYNREYYKRNKERLLAYQREYSKRPGRRKKDRERQLKWRENNRDRARRRASEYWKNNRERLIAQRRQHRKQVRELVITKLGGKCVVCGEVDLRCLQIDHIHGGGTQERKKLDCHQLCDKLLNMPLVEATRDYQILCANHNCIKLYENGEIQ